ncbi:MAG: cation transporter [Candidatus Latescibacteria bacterium]|nr:cation transporter [Candidatus Latescibacterota bacterium]
MPNHSDAHTQNHSHDMRRLTKRKLWIALTINAVFLIIEVIGGIVTNSLALLADAGHMLTDVAALLLAIFVATLAERPPTPRRTYGLLRAEVLGAFINGAALMVIVALIFHEALKRLDQVPVINGPLMLCVAVMGLLANMASAWVLFGSRNENINIRGAFLHMTADALGSVGAIVAGVVIWTTGWILIDPVVSIFIGIIILWSSWGLIAQTMNILLEATPENIDYHEVKKALLAIEHVTGIHDLHIWTIASGIPSLSVHISLESQCSDTTHWQECLRDAQAMLRERFGIVHSTLQFEPENFKRDQRTI